MSVFPSHIIRTEEIGPLSSQLKVLTRGESVSIYTIRKNSPSGNYVPRELGKLFFEASKSNPKATASDVQMDRVFASGKKMGLFTLMRLSLSLSHSYIPFFFAPLMLMRLLEDLYLDAAHRDGCGKFYFRMTNELYTYAICISTPCSE